MVSKDCWRAIVLPSVRWMRVIFVPHTLRSTFPGEPSPFVCCLGYRETVLDPIFGGCLGPQDFGRLLPGCAHSRQGASTFRGRET